ncbi:MAG: alpha/beta hydrolase [Anaerolineae bacterium]
MTTLSLYKSAAGEQAVMATYETALQHWAAPFTTRMIATRYGSTFVIASGDETAPPLVLLHGAGGNSTIWAGDVGQFCRRFRVYAVDLVGEAGKSAPTRPEWDSPAFAEWLEDVLTGLQLQQAVLVGVSQGAWTALKFAVTAPQRVSKLVLIAPGGIIPDRLSFALKAVVLMLFGQWGIKAPRTRSLRGMSRFWRGHGDCGANYGSFLPRMGALPIFSDVELQRLMMPILLVGGTKDIMRDVDKIAARPATVPDLTVRRVLCGTRDVGDGIASGRFPRAIDKT